MLVLAYDGTAFCGFQRQKKGRTVQEELELALNKITGQEIRVTGAGRTDAGAHALGQVVNFRFNGHLSCYVLQRALNSVLPADITVESASKAEDSFSARYSAKSRHYRYTILNREPPSPFWRNYAYHFRKPLNVVAMDEASKELIGIHDLVSFSGKTTRRTWRQVCQAEVTKVGDLVYIDLEADAFLPKMVRTIAGTLLWVGINKIDRAGLRQILEARDRIRAGPTLPAHGLCLVRVNYSAEEHSNEHSSSQRERHSARVVLGGC